MKSPSTTNKSAVMKEMYDVMINLTASPLYAYRVKNHYVPVLGEGSYDASILFIGEAPGKKEAETGRPFCGAAGTILNHLLSSIHLPRESVYITNIVNDRPPNNRDPLPEEIACYAPFLDKQIDTIQPRVIATLGRFSMDYIMRRYGLADSCGPISTLHGQLFSGTTPLGTPISVIPLYHPAVAIYNRNKIGELEHDFSVLKQFL